MGKYRDQYLVTKKNRDMFARFHERTTSYGGYDPNSLAVQLNEAGYRASQSAYNRELEQLEPLMLNEMQEEIYQKIMKNLSANIKVDTSQLSKSIAEGINSAMKSLGK